jgi:hypothetical protein
MDGSPCVLSLLQFVLIVAVLAPFEVQSRHTLW